MRALKPELMRSVLSPELHRHPRSGRDMVPADGSLLAGDAAANSFEFKPRSWAASTAQRTVLPTNDGTSIPPCSTSNTTVPVIGNFDGDAGVRTLVSASRP